MPVTDSIFSPLMPIKERMVQPRETSVRLGHTTGKTDVWLFPLYGTALQEVKCPEVLCYGYGPAVDGPRD